MRANGPLISLLALAMAAVLILTTQPAEAQSKEILLPLTFNEVAKGDVAAVMRGDDVFLKAGDLERFGMSGIMWTRVLAFSGLRNASRISIGDTQFISLKALAPYMTFTVDPATLSLAVTANPQLLAPTNLNVQLGPPPGIVYSKDKSSFLNYSITDQPGDGAYPTAAFTYLLVYRDQQDAAKGSALLNFIWWAVHDGQKEAAALDYAPLPKPVVEKVEQTLKRMTVNGKPVLASSK